MNFGQVKFSVIIPVYNRRKLVSRTLQSVLRQTHRPIELILVDNASDDGSMEVLRAFQCEHHSEDFSVKVATEEVRTAAATRNRGVELATAPWLCFFDSDDEMLPTLLEEYARVITDSRCQLDIVIGSRTLCWGDGSRRRAPFFTSDLVANHILHSVLSTQAYVVRRAYFAHCGGWRADLPVWNDFELGLRLLLHDPSISYMYHKDLVLVHHQGEASITGNEFHSRKGLWERAINAMIDLVQKSEHPQRDRLLKLLQYRRLVLAAHYQREGFCQDAKEIYISAMPQVATNILMRSIINWLYRRVVVGKRGSARIARWLMR